MSNSYTISSLLAYDNKSKVNIKNDDYINISNYLTTYPTNNSIYPCKVNNNQLCYLKKRNLSNIIINNEYICLLDKSIDELIQESELNEINKRVLIRNNNIDSNIHVNINNSHINNSLNKSDFSLWVDKYAPKSFTQLLSPERINREVLKALKEWDSFIFHRHNNTSTYPEKNILTNWNSSNRYGGFEELRQRMTPKSKDKEDDNDIDIDVDDNKHNNKRLFNKISDDNNDNEIKFNKKKFVNNDLRPHHKVILLCGPPGTGKTTLAHIVAKHCNYRPIEINASDDRSIDSLYNLLSSCLSSQSLDISNMSSDKEKQPNCVILDEIDGIDNVKTIQMIISLIKEPLKSNDRSAHGDDGSDNELDSTVVSKGKAKSKSKGSHRPFPVTRPIICICNDLYAPILRTFREHCLIFQFTLPTELRLVQRLKQIIDKENISKYFDIKLLTTLVNNMGYDIRATINTLQFATSRFIDSGLVSQLDSKIDSKLISSTANTKSISEMLNICLKDEGRDIYQIWRLILSQRDMKLLLTKKKKRLLDSNIDSKVDNKLPTKVDSKSVSRIESQSDDKINSTVINKSNDSYIDNFIAEEESFNDDYYQYMNEIEDDIIYNQSTSKSFDNTIKQSTNEISTQLTNQMTNQLSSQLNNKLQYKAPASLSAMIEAMYAMASHDNHDLIILGLFTNLTTSLLTDPTLQKVTYLSNCYSYIDLFDGFMRSNGDGYVLLQYLSIIAGATHILTANDSSSNPKIAYPHKEKEIHFKLSQNNNIIRNLIDGVITSSIRDCNYNIIPHMNNNTIYSLDILPYLLGLLNPKFKSNNINSFNSYEKFLLQNVSDMMLSYTLTYQTNFQFNQSSSIQLDPPINKVISYELVDNVDIDRQIVRSTNLLSNDIKIIIQSEMKKIKIQKEIEKIKALGVKAKNVILSPNRSTIKLKTKTPDSQIKPTSSPIVEIIESSKSNGKVDSFFTKKRKLTNDLISKQLTNNSSSLMNNSCVNQTQSKSKPLFYKYNQGFSNAVRRPVNINEFI